MTDVRIDSRYGCEVVEGFLLPQGYTLETLVDMPAEEKLEHCIAEDGTPYWMWPQRTKTWRAQLFMGPSPGERLASVPAATVGLQYIRRHLAISDSRCILHRMMSFLIRKGVHTLVFPALQSRPLTPSVPHPQNPSGGE